MIRIACAALSLLCIATLPAQAGSSSSANFANQRDVMGAGGITTGSSANFSMGSTAGQPAIGAPTSANFNNAAGFWTLSTIAFTLTAQTNVPIVATITSNVVNVSGLSSAVAISIVGGTYSINGAAYTSAAGTVSNGDTVTVQQVSSATYAATTIATLTIDGVTGDFSVTTAAAPPTVPTLSGPNGGTGGGTISTTVTPGAGQPASCGFDPGSQFIPLIGAPQSPPAGSSPQGITFPFGLFDFAMLGCAPGGPVTITITYPQPVPAGAQYWKYGPTAANPAPHWYIIPATFSGNTVTFTLTDGGLGDDDMTANGIIIDQGGPGIPPGGPIPTLSDWALLALATLMGLFALASLRRREP